MIGIFNSKQKELEKQKKAKEKLKELKKKKEVVKTTLNTNVIKDSLEEYDYEYVKEFSKLGIVPIEPLNPSSKPNRVLQEGLFWTKKKELEDNGFTTPSENKFYIDNMMMFKDYGQIDSNNISKFGKVFKVGEQTLSIDLNTSIYFEKIDLTRTILALGGVGSGKTEWAFSIVKQDSKFNRIVYHDIKGDFTQKKFREYIDIIFNVFDKRGTDWNIFIDLDRNLSLSEAFSEALITAVVGDSDDKTWIAFGSKIINDALLYAFSQTEDNKLRWLYFIEHLEKFQKEAEEEGRGTKSSSWANVATVFSLLKLMAYRIAIQNQKTFSIYEFMEKKDIQLFLLNNSAYQKKLSPLFSAFLGTFIDILMSRSDTKTDLTQLMLDEFLSLKIPENQQLKLFTAARSKGCQLIVMAQYLKETDKELLQLISSSRYAMLLFSIKDDFTVKTMSESFKKVKYWKKIITASNSQNQSNEGKEEGSVSSNTKSITRNIQEQESEMDFLSIPDIQGIPKYHHITNLSSEKITYLGYTPSVSPDEFLNNKDFDEINQKEFLFFDKDNTFTEILQQKLIEQEQKFQKEEFKEKGVLKNHFTTNDFNKILKHLNNEEHEEILEFLEMFDLENIEENLKNKILPYLKEQSEEHINNLKEFIEGFFVKKEKIIKEKEDIKDNKNDFMIRQITKQLKRLKPDNKELLEHLTKQLENLKPQSEEVLNKISILSDEDPLEFNRILKEIILDLQNLQNNFQDRE